MILTGLSRPISRNAPPSLLIINYHRLRPSPGASSRFDDGVFDTDLDTFRRQMRWLKSATTVLDEEGLLSLGERPRSPQGVIYSAVTFDDGYVDCATLARPVLDEFGIRAIFFIPQGIIESRCLGWWDLAAHMLKLTSQSTVQVRGSAFDLRGDRQLAIRQVLNLFKLEKAERTAGLLDELSDACGVPLPGKDEQSSQLMTWSQIRELKGAGHGVGSHAVSHRVLATLGPETQAEEIMESRRWLQHEVGSDIVSFAYPVGGPRHLDHHSVRLVRQAGYSQAFTFNTGIASVPVADRFQIPRESARTLSALKAKALLPRVMGLKECLVVG
jgi:peptidoglycan/xylan/chitin deacetylase (PgdA/CDA1 family)